MRQLVGACVKIELFEVTYIDDRHLLLKMCHISTCSQCLPEELQHYRHELNYGNATHASLAAGQEQMYLWGHKEKCTSWAMEMRKYMPVSI